MWCVHTQVLRKGDVLMEFDGVPIANDGTVPFRARERIFFTAFTTLKPTGSTARVKVSGRACKSAGWVQGFGVTGIRQGKLHLVMYFMHCKRCDT